MQQASPLVDGSVGVRGRSHRVRHTPLRPRTWPRHELAAVDAGSRGRTGNRHSSSNLRCQQQSIDSSHREEWRATRCDGSISDARGDDLSVLGRDWVDAAQPTVAADVALAYGRTKGRYSGAEAWVPRMPVTGGWRLKEAAERDGDSPRWS